MAAICARPLRLVNLGIAIMARRPMIATTVISSMRVNPARFTSAQACKRRATEVGRAGGAKALRGRNRPGFGGVNVAMTPSLGTQLAGNAGVDARSAARSGTFLLGGDLPVHRLGFGAMRLTGKGIWGEPRDVREAIAVLRRAVALGVNLIDTERDSAAQHGDRFTRSEEHTSELQSPCNLVCRLLLEKKKQ